MSLEEKKKTYQTPILFPLVPSKLSASDFSHIDSESPSGPWLSLKKAEIFSFHIQCCLVISSLLITTLKDGIYETPCYILLVNALNQHTGYSIANPPFNTLIPQPDTLLMERVIWLLLFSHSVVSLCDPMDCSTPGLPVHHQLPELAQTHIHRVGAAIPPSHPLSSPSLPAFNLSQHQRLSQWVAMPYLQGIFLTQGSNLRLVCLLHYLAGSLCLTSPGMPYLTLSLYFILLRVLKRSQK